MDAKTVMFVTDKADVSEFLYNLFNESKTLKRDYFVEGSLSTRESAVADIRKKRPDLVIFFFFFSGMLSLSETLYNIRLAGSRVIFISSQRSAGDGLLEVLVGYGIYDIVLSSEITKGQLAELIENPRGFVDVAIYHRMVEIKDDGLGSRNFKIPDLDTIKSLSNHIQEDYLLDKRMIEAERKAPKINQEDDSKGVSSAIYSEKLNARQLKKQKALEKKQAKARAKKRKNQPQKASNRDDGLTDVDLF